jgi:primosomal protein N'
MVRCERCNKLTYRLTHNKGELVCDDCHAIPRCKTCDSEITIESDRIGEGCVECQ